MLGCTVVGSVILNTPSLLLKSKVSLLFLYIMCCTRQWPTFSSPKYSSPFIAYRRSLAEVNFSDTNWSLTIVNIRCFSSSMVRLLLNWNLKVGPPFCANWSNWLSELTKVHSNYRGKLLVTHLLVKILYLGSDPESKLLKAADERSRRRLVVFKGPRQDLPHLLGYRLEVTAQTYAISHQVVELTVLVVAKQNALFYRLLPWEHQVIICQGSDRQLLLTVFNCRVWQPLRIKCRLKNLHPPTVN